MAGGSPSQAGPSALPNGRMDIRIATSEGEIASCFVVMRELRPQLRREEFVDRVRRLEREGYQLAFLEGPEGVVAVAGFRILDSLASGRFLFLDDLVTHPAHRSRGHGVRMLAWLLQKARDEGCGQLQLDSGIQRRDAHRFYEREGMTMTGFHYAVNVSSEGNV
jgi:GNAT superfamily N-acetyltransferase